MKTFHVYSVNISPQTSTCHEQNVTVECELNVMARGLYSRKSLKVNGFFLGCPRKIGAGNQLRDRGSQAGQLERQTLIFFIGFFFFFYYYYYTKVYRKEKELKKGQWIVMSLNHDCVFHCLHINAVNYKLFHYKIKGFESALSF